MAFKMKGFPMQKESAMKMKKGDGQVPLSAYESKVEKINDLEDRIEFLQSDLNEGKGDIAQLKILKAKLAQLKNS